MADWDLPQTEEGLQECLRRIEQYRRDENLTELGNGLLALAFLVKWVRSDTHLPPFPRAHQLALEAYDVFVRADDERGQVRALISASPFSPPATRQQMLEEADAIATRIGDERLSARVLAARARSTSMSNRPGAKEMNIKALEVFRRLGDWHDLATTLFSLSISDGTAEEKRDFALEAANLYRDHGMPADAARCVDIALMNAEEIEPLASLEPLVRQGLEDAKAADKAFQIRSFYDKLALIAAEKGRPDEANQYRQLAKELQNVDGQTPLERWESDVEMTKMLLATFKAEGNKEAEREFRKALKELKAAKPKD
ncbi:MAG: hypothetical protein GC165_02060 [Armatimonadetes bacterium]|nr:hypothetical protein [Armatimonadota bacterium]